MDNLNNLRNKINDIDGNIAEFLLQRFEVVKEISEYKKAHSLEIFQQNREAEVLQNVSDKTDNPKYKKYMLEIYETILKTSKLSQQ